MRWRVYVLALVLLLLPAGISAASSQAGVVLDEKLTFAPADLYFSEENGYKRVHLKNALGVGEIGHPELPARRVSFVIPGDMSVGSVFVVSVSYCNLEGRFRIFPKQPDVPGNESSPFIPADEEAYSLGQWTPAALVRHTASGYLRGTKVAELLVFPVQYSPADGRLRLAETIEIRIELVPSTDVAVPRRRVVARWEQGMQRALASLIANPEMLDVLASAEIVEEVPKGKPRPIFKPSVDSSPVEYVIITADSLEAEFQALADWKTSCGVNTVVRSLSWIRANYPNGADLQETVRNFIKDAYSNWGTVWVLLGGDTSILPCRYGLLNYYGGAEIPTDLYFSCLDGNWNANGNSEFGEAPRVEGDSVIAGDDADLYPDVFVGRAPVDTKAEAALFVSKTIQYLQSPALAYLPRLLLLGEVLFPADWSPGEQVSLDGAQLCEDVANMYLPVSFHVTKLYENYEAYPGAYQETRQSVLDSLDVGYGLVHHIGHGYRNTLSVGYGTLDNNDVDGLVNAPNISVLYTMNCSSAAFDFNPIAERFILNPVGGGVCYIGATRYDFPNTGWSYQNEFYRLLFDVGMTEIGKALAVSKVPYIIYSQSDGSHRWTQFTTVLLGDPQLSVWTSPPESLSVSHASSFSLGSQSFQVSVSSQGQAVDSALVCLWKGSEAYAIDYTDAVGNASVPFNPHTAGTFTLSVVDTNRLVYQVDLDVTVPASPNLYAQYVLVDDDSTGLSAGNGDYRLDAGETVELSVTVKNTGGADAHNVVGQISLNDPYVGLVDDSCSYGTLLASGSSSGQDGYLVTLSKDTPDQYEVLGTITMQSDEGQWTDNIVFRAYSREMDLYETTIWDTIGAANGNGIVEAGETVDLEIDFRNIGKGASTPLSAVLRSSDPGITITDSTSACAPLAGGATGSGDPFRFECSTSGSHLFSLEIQDSYGCTWNKVLDVSSPGTPVGVTGMGAASWITLTWDPNPEADLKGYNVYRADTETGPYARVNDYTILRTAKFVDDELPPFTRYFYKISAQDSSGNESGLSDWMAVSTNPPLHSGWPITMGRETPSSPCLGNVDFSPDGSLEIVVGADHVYVWHEDGSELLDGDNDERTSGVFCDEGEYYASAPSLADLDSDGEMEIIGASWETSEVYVWNADGTVAAGWPAATGGYCWGSPAIGDIDDDGYDEIVITCADGKIYAWNADGTEVVDGDLNPATIGVFYDTGTSYFYSSPALADIDEDGVVEVVAAAPNGVVYVLNGDATLVPGWPFNAAEGITGSPAVGDIDNDGHLEVAFPSDWNMHVLSHQGAEEAGWPQFANMSKNTRSPSIALADLDSDGYLEVITATTNGIMFVRKHDGTVFPGWGYVTYGSYPEISATSECSPTVADADGDGLLEIFQGGEDGKLYAWNHDGTELNGFPIHTNGEVRGAAAVWDLDGDGYVEVILAGWDKNMYVWDCEGSFDMNLAPWPMFGHDAKRTNFFGSSVLVDVPRPRLSAGFVEDRVEIRWRDPAGLGDFAGWNIYRKESENGMENGLDASGAGGSRNDQLEGYRRLNRSLLRPEAGEMVFEDVSVLPGFTYYYVVEKLGKEGERKLEGPVKVVMGGNPPPKRALAGQNYPNPFNPQTTITYQVPLVRNGSAWVTKVPVSIRVFDIYGRLLRTLVNEEKSPGYYSVSWDGRTGSGKSVSSGVYFYRAEIGGKRFNRKMTLIR